MRCQHTLHRRDGEKKKTPIDGHISFCVSIPMHAEWNVSSSQTKMPQKW